MTTTLQAAVRAESDARRALLLAEAETKRCAATSPGPRILSDPPAAQILCGIAAVVGVVAIVMVVRLLIGGAP